MFLNNSNYLESPFLNLYSLKDYTLGSKINTLCTLFALGLDNFII